MSGASSPARTPSPLASLPVDLLPSLLEPLAFRRADLRNLCLVNQQWNAVATPLLYRWIRMFGRDLVNTPALFEQLAQSPRLCLLVRKLEIRVFPLSMILKERWAMEEQAVKVLRQARNVRELIWTRKGAMSDELRLLLPATTAVADSLPRSILEAITDLPNLDSFEFNASAGIAWTPTLLLKLPRLRSLSVILPDRTVASLLPSILANQQKLAEGDGLGLEELTILCRESPVVNDKIMLECATALAHGSLTNLALAGCAKLTNAHLLRLLPSLPKLRHLALEATGISPSFYTLAAPHLSSLLSLKITHPGPRHPLLAEFLPSVAHLLRHTPQLHSFTLYHSGSSTGAQGVREWPVVGSEFIEDLVASVGGGLRKFECSGVLMRISTLVALTDGARQLRDLVAHLGHELELVRSHLSLECLDLNIYRHRTPSDKALRIYPISKRSTSSLSATTSSATTSSPSQSSSSSSLLPRSPFSPPPQLLAHAQPNRLPQPRLEHQARPARSRRRDEQR